jgi:hypothetical protein
MLRIDNNLLQEVGLGTLPDSEKNSLLRHIYETLEMRVGIRLADQMSNEQLDEFERYFEAKDDAGAFKWLETNFPNYKQIVQEEFDKLKAEVAQSAPQILSSSIANQQQPQSVAPQAAAPAAPYNPAPAQPQPQPVTPMPAAPVAPAAPAPAAPIPPAPPIQRDINMPMQAPTLNSPQPQPAPYNQGQTPTPYGSPQTPPQSPNNPQTAAQPFNPPYPEQQPPAGPGVQPQF